VRTRVSRRFVIVLLLCACRPGICQTKNTSEEDRRGRPLQEYIQEFFLSDAVRCQEKGEWQLTAGVDSRQHIGTSSVLRTEYGLTNRLQLSAEVPYGLNEEETLDTRSRWSTVSLGIDYQIIRSSTPFALSVGMSFGVPVRSLSEIEYEPTILMAKSFHKLQVHASFVADVEEEKPSIQYN
jgi:hypothetical protein